MYPGHLQLVAQPSPCTGAASLITVVLSRVRPFVGTGNTSTILDSRSIFSYLLSLASSVIILSFGTTLNPLGAFTDSGNTRNPGGPASLFLVLLFDSLLASTWVHPYRR